MQPILAFNMDEAKAWSFLIVGSVAALAAAVGTILNAIQNYRNSQKLDVAHQQREEAKAEAEEAKAKAEQAKVVMDKTLKNTNGGVHKMTKKIEDLETQVKSLNSQNTNLKHDAAEKQGKAKPRPSPKTR